MARTKIQPRLVFADPNGDIYDHPDLSMLVRRGRELAPPRPDEIIPLPPESELFLLPGRSAVGLNPQTGRVEALEENAVAAFVCPAYTLSASAAYHTRKDAPRLPLFAYGAVGFAEDRFWIAARRVDLDKRQVFTGIDPERIRKGAAGLMKKFPDNRLVNHLAGCALTYGCPAAKNLALGRFEAPLPTARQCNAGCVGCISLQPKNSGFPSTQQRIAFTPTPGEIVQIMTEHARREKRPVFSFGQGCEGEPLTEAETIARAVADFRARGGPGTVNINTNASLPETIEPLARAGLTSIRVSLNSADPDLYRAYYRPGGYDFDSVRRTIARAKQADLFVSLNFLFFPGVSDTESELAALAWLVEEHRVDFIQMRNLNLDPELYLEILPDKRLGPCMGLKNFMKRLKKACAWVEFGYFNPYLGDTAETG